MAVQKRIDNTIPPLHLPDSEKTKARRAHLLAEFLSYYATGRITPALTIQKSQGNQSNLKTDTVEMLAAFREKRLTESDQLKGYLEHYNQSFRSDTARFLREVSVARIKSSSTQKVKLKGETQDRKITVQRYLEELRWKRENKNSTRKIPQPGEVLIVEKALPATPVATATPGEIKSGSNLEPLEIPELFLFLMTYPEKFNLEQLQQFFGTQRLYSQWNRFVNLFEEFKPGSRVELERLREHQISLYAVVSY